MLPHWGVIVFDLDGTLIPGRTVNSVLGEAFNFGDEQRYMENAFVQGRASNSEVADTLARCLRGLRADEIEEVVRSIDVIDGAREASSWLRSLGLKLALASLTWDIVVRCVAQSLQMDPICAVELEQDGGRCTGRVLRHVEPSSKTDALRLFCIKSGVTLPECVAVGDGNSDLPLFRSVGFALALNGTSAARAAADVAIDTPALMPALRLIPGLPGFRPADHS